jgi:hypothetical protein
MDQTFQVEFCSGYRPGRIRPMRRGVTLGDAHRVRPLVQTGPDPAPPAGLEQSGLIC